MLTADPATQRAEENGQKLRHDPAEADLAFAPVRRRG
jgi:hypothetical protein